VAYEWNPGCGTWRITGYLETVSTVTILSPLRALLPSRGVPPGAGLTRQLRAMPAFADLPILAVSAAATSEVRRLALEAGATAFQEKPLDPKGFLDTVAHLVEKPPAGGGVKIRRGQGA